MTRSPPSMSLLFLLMLSQLSLLVSSTDSASDTVESLFDSAKGIKVGGSILAIAAIAAGAVMVVMGYRLFRVTLFAVGFVAGGVVVAMVVEHVFDDKSWVITASWIAFVVGGLICGSIVVSLYTLGIFVAGAAAGVALAMLIHNSVGYEIYPSHPQVVLIVLCIVLGIIGGVLTLKLEKPVLIIATSLFGAAILVWGVGYFAGDFPSTSDLKAYATKDINGDWVYSIPDAWWAYLAGILVLFVLGLFVQFRKTGRDGVYHKSRAVGRQTPNVQYVEAGTPQPNVHYGNPGIPGSVDWGVGYFAGDFPSTSDLKAYATKDINGDWVYSIPDAWWAYLAGILVLFVLGLFIQFRKTGRDGVYHKSRAVGRQTPNVQYVEAGTPQQNVH
ncbi:hypothetical protein PF005_g18408 [Phytophthora fragariae]|uniref:Transmembrane protein 198 n=1 Tax=Phytophthora fragariae TaxID=53985 RepID=A0A6A4CMF2_9STRA|nr:hypothetical protein PF003_g24756 [Phytophthora fragariae]KAE8930635.1 hypothetical protein PF009_g19288 [Phytophthora fragariae]KAE9090971.1 hypothetical protein PF007_g19050 [Phytophthora fragariae]KAE9093748.1 hypothetical protein PF010_g17371 [Phytophthora fragariae]KAE9123000.1 hypothetical protein PF006_g17526 [Phytophthora fragariae]